MKVKTLRAREEAGHAVWQSGTIGINLNEGFALKVHETFPDAPRSPIYISLRPKGVKDGQLEPEHLDKIGYAIGVMAMQHGQMFQKGTYTWIAGIPAAGEPILEAIIRTIGPRRKRRLLEFKLEKEVMNDGRRRIKGVHLDYAGILPNDREDQHVLVDDLMSNMDTKIEAVRAIGEYGASVSTLLLFLDRSVRGSEKLKALLGLKTLAVWNYDGLLDFGLAHGYISRQVYETIITYPQLLEAYKRTQQAA